MFFLRNWRREQALKKARVSEAQWLAVETRLPFLARLPESGQRRLRKLAVQFLAEKEMHGAHGLRLSEDARLSIALQACLPILNLGLDYYRGWVGIVVYPGEFVVPRTEMDEAGVVHEYDDILSGEAWEGGPVLLSWPDDADTGNVNVVIHEFAHKLDMLNGTADGMPPLHADMRREDWTRDFTAAYRDFCARLDRGETWLPLDPYAAEHPSEFFAVASEAFFIDPLTLQEAYPEIYRQLALFYRQETAIA